MTVVWPYFPTTICRVTLQAPNHFEDPKGYGWSTWGIGHRWRPEILVLYGTKDGSRAFHCFPLPDAETASCRFMRWEDELNPCGNTSSINHIPPISHGGLPEHPYEYLTLNRSRQWKTTALNGGLQPGNFMELKNFTHVWWHRRPIGIMWPTQKFSPLVIFWIPLGHRVPFYPLPCGRRGPSGRAAAGTAKLPPFIAEALRSDLTRGGGAGSAGHGRGIPRIRHIPSSDKGVPERGILLCSKALDFPCDAFSKRKLGIWDRIGRAVRADRCAKLMEKVCINWIEESYVVSPAMKVSERFHRRFIFQTLGF